MSFFIPTHIADNLAMTLALFGAMLALRLVCEWGIRRSSDAVLARRRRFTLRAVSNAALALALLAIWISEIQDALFSLAAVMVALVVATKELIMCAAGSMLRVGGHLFKVGDRIEMNGIHGEVLDHGLFSTTIMELPPRQHGHAGTGRTVMVPNSVLLTMPVRLEAQPRQYAPHRFMLTLEQAGNVAAVLKALEEAAEKALAADLERAMRFHRLSAGKAGAEVAGPGFDVSVATSEIGKVQFHVMIYCLVQDARRLEQQILVSVLTDRSTQREPKPVESRVWEEIGRQLKTAAPANRQDAA